MKRNFVAFAAVAMVFFVCGSIQAQANPGTTGAAQSTEIPSAAVYKVGDIGPAGGLIFYDKGNNQDGWRYLEAAPAETEKQAAFYINYASRENSRLSSTLNTEDGLGAGKNNTELICAYLMSIGQWDMSAQVCDELEVNGYDDWYLPSFLETSLMYGILHRKGLGNFQSNGSASDLSAVYYSSTIKRSENYPYPNLPMSVLPPDKWTRS